MHSLTQAVAGQLPGQAGAAINHRGSSQSYTSADSAVHGPGSNGTVLAAVGARVFAPLLLAAGLVMLVVKNGKMLVDRPQLCPQLANTVVYAEQAEQAKQQQQ